jgi:PAS domain S-box-containing protein
MRDADVSHERLSRYRSRSNVTAMTRLGNADLRESEQGYRLLFESNPHPMWIYDRDTLAFLAVNEAAIQHYGYSREDFLGMTLKDIRPSEDIPWLLKKVAEVIPGMNSASSRHLKKDGTLIQVEIVSHTLQFEDRRAELVLAMDVTAHKTSDASARRPPGLNQGGRDGSSFIDPQLTETERHVAHCVARGYSNKQIAAELRVSVRTIENHISHILNKKSFVNRVQLARYVFEREQDSG